MGSQPDRERQERLGAPACLRPARPDRGGSLLIRLEVRRQPDLRASECCHGNTCSSVIGAEPDRELFSLRAGGAASAVVAALVAVVGVLICEGVLNLEMAPPPLLPIGRSLSVQYAVTSAVLALAATGLGHVLVLTTPRPSPSSRGSSDSPPSSGSLFPRELGVLGRPLATALVDLAIGLCVLTLVRSLLGRTTQRVLPGPWRAPDQDGPITPPPDGR